MSAKQAPGGPFDPWTVAGLDIGIRNTVLRLRAANFDTIDSGDGRSKHAAGIDDEGTIPEPHVMIGSTPDEMLADARRLRDFLVPKIETPDWRIEASFDPNDESAVIMLFGVDDNAWTTEPDE